MAGNVKHLDTVHFNDTMSAYANYIKQFEGIVRGVNSAASTMVDNWKGKGRNAFEKDSKQVQLNLKDISDIMYDLRDALIDAHAEYMKTDSSLSKSFES
jgi:WXG100 family type VII secretion target